MAKYRKTALVEAVQWHKAGDHPAVDSVWQAGGAVCHTISTLEGPLTVKPGDWIAGPGARGEFWPIKPDVFAATYEPADDA